MTSPTQGIHQPKAHSRDGTHSLNTETVAADSKSSLITAQAPIKASRSRHQVQHHHLADRFVQVRAHTERLAARLSAEDQTAQSMPEASPTKWHRGHTTWFFEEFVLAADPTYRRVDQTYQFLFNSYYNTVGDRHPRPKRGLITRPSAAQVGQYRQAVDDLLVAALTAGVCDELAAVVELGLHHEQQHQELLLMDVKHLLWQNSTRPIYQEAVLPSAVERALSWQHQEAGPVLVGHDGTGFAFDNEGPIHRQWIEPTDICNRLVTNGEWLEFMSDGGYRNPALWLSDGFAAACSAAWEAPQYWFRHNDSWWQYTLHGCHQVDPHAPVVHVSYYEADAFARWAGHRLPTEAQWEVSATGDAGVTGSLAHPADAGGGWFGQVWQWTASPYTPYPGFAPSSGAIGEYNGKFMVNQYVLRGSSCITPAGHGRITYRNFFSPDSRWVFAGLRLASDG